MTTIAATEARARRDVGAPKLRLLASGEQPRFAGQAQTARGSALREDRAWRNGYAHAHAHASTALAHAPEHTVAVSSTDAPVLVVARDATQRAAMVDELTQTMPADTAFVHASAFWEVLVLAGSSRMVIVSGDVDEMPTGSLMRVLGHRYPALPVIALEAPAALAHA